MAAAQRPGEITYYEELGVENTASPDEIRDAFRVLVRLLHPDQQTDPQLREMAEQQMRKLNRIYAVLSDPARRATYDRTLVPARSSPVVVLRDSGPSLRKLLARNGFVAAAIVGAFLLIWFAIASNGPSEVRGQESPDQSADRYEPNSGDPGERIAQLNERIRTLETERNSALRQLGTVGGKQVPGAIAKRPVTAGTFAALAPAARTPSGGIGTVPGIERFTGSWRYSHAGQPKPARAKTQYQPELIEVSVTEQNGTLFGRYHSHYPVLESTLSPDVDFVFAGTPNGSTLRCAWQGNRGAKGRMTLKLLPASAVEIAWNATELGTDQWLLDGTATLTRK